MIAWYLARKHEHPGLIALGRKTLANGRATTLTVKLNTRGRNLLRRGGRVTLSNSITFTPTRHAAIHVARRVLEP